MGRESIQQTTPDLFSNEVRDVSADQMERGSDIVTAAATPSKRHILPENLEHAVKLCCTIETPFLNRRPIAEPVLSCGTCDSAPLPILDTCFQS
jgi:hypothetical protein